MMMRGILFGAETDLNQDYGTWERFEWFSGFGGCEENVLTQPGVNRSENAHAATSILIL